MSVFDENPFFLILDSTPSSSPVNVVKNSEKIVELTDVACNTRRSFSSIPSVTGNSAVPTFVTSNNFKYEWDNVRANMHNQPGRYKGGRDDYCMPNNNGFRGVYCPRECTKDSTNSQPPWMMNSRAPRAMYQDYPFHSTKRKPDSKKMNQNAVGHPGKDIWSCYWTDNALGKENLDSYTVKRNPYQPARDRQGFEPHRPTYQHGIHREYPAGRSSKASTNANMSDGSRRGDSYVPRDRRTRWESTKSPIYHEELYMTPQQRMQATFMRENSERIDYSSEKSDDSMWDGIRGSRIRSRTYSPPVDRCKYHPLKDKYNEDYDEEYFSMATDIDGGMKRDILLASHRMRQPNICETSSIPLMHDISRSSTLTGEKACFRSRERNNCENLWVAEANNGERRQRKKSTHDVRHCSPNCSKHQPLTDSPTQKSAQPCGSKDGYETFSKKNVALSSNSMSLPQAASSYSVFPNKDSNVVAFCTTKTVCVETNTDPLDFQKESIEDARVLFTVALSQTCIHRTESCGVGKKESHPSAMPNSTKASECNESSKIMDDASPSEMNEKTKSAAGLIASTTAYLKRKFTSSKEISADQATTSNHHSVKDDAKRRKPERASRLPVRIDARNKTGNLLPSSPSFEIPTANQRVTGGRETSPDHEDRTPRAAVKSKVGATSPRISDLSRPRESPGRSSHQSPNRRMETKELQPLQVTTINPRNIGFSRNRTTSLKESHPSAKGQRNRPISKYTNFIRKPRQK